MARRHFPLTASGRHFLCNNLVCLPRTALALALRGIPIGVAVAGVVAAPLACAADGGQAVSTQKNYAVPAGPLGTALSDFASQAGVTVQADSRLVEGLSTKGIHGAFTVYEGFSTLLEGTGLVIAERTAGVFLVVPRPPQVSTAERALPAVKVKAKSDDSTTEGTGSYTTGTLTIGKVAHSIRETPQSVSVITRQRMDDQNLTDLNDVLAQAAGISLQPTSADLTYMSSRGFIISKYMIDGQPTPAATGYTDSQVMDMAMYDRVEILRGATGLLQGAGNPGGTINMVRKRPGNQLAMSSSLQFGSWEKRRGVFDVGGPLSASGKLRGRVVAAYGEGNYFYDTPHKNTDNLYYGIVEYDLTPSTLLTLGGSLERRHYGVWYWGLPRYVDGRDTHLPRSTSLLQDWSYQDADKNSGFLSLEQHVGDWTAKLALNHLSVDNHGRYAGNLASIDPTTGAGASLQSGMIANRDAQTDADLQLSGPFTLFGRRHELLLGADLQRDKRYADWDYVLDGYTPVAFDIFDGVPQVDEPASIRTRIRAPFAGRTREHGYYGSLRMSVTDPLTLIVGARAGWYAYRYHETGSSTAFEKRGQVSPYGGLVYDISRQYSLYASYADIYAPQSNKDRHGAFLSPVIGANYETGIKGEFYDGALNASLAVFRIIQDNLPQEDLSSPCSDDNQNCYIAQGKVRSQGLDVQIDGELLPGWQVSAGYTFDQTKYLEDATRKGQPYSVSTPKHLLKLWTSYRLPGALQPWTVGGGFSMQSATYQTRVASSGVYFQQGGYTLASARVEYRINDHWSAALNVDNLFDKTYYARASSGFMNWYGEPRNFMLTLRGSL